MTRRGSLGFTLLELLVALSVFTVLAALVYGMVRLGSRSWADGRARIDAAEALRIGWRFVQDSLGDSRPEPTGDPEIPGVRFTGAATAVEYVANLPAHLGTGGLHLLTLGLARGDDPGEQWLVLRRVPLALDLTGQRVPDLARAQEAVLADDVVGLQFQYYGQQADDVAPRWRWDWRGQETLPALIRLDLALTGDRLWPVLVARPRFAQPRQDKKPVRTREAATERDGEPGRATSQRRRVQD
jgi:general secretion pathway protein J